MASQCTEQAVHEFLMERGGRVPQMELIDHFLSVLGKNDQSKESVEREMLTRIVDNVGFVKVENGVTFVCLKAEGSEVSVMRTDTDGHDHAELCHRQLHHAMSELDGNDNKKTNMSNVSTGASSSLAVSLDNDKQSNGNGQPADPSPNNKTNTAAPTSSGGGEVKLRERRRRESLINRGSRLRDSVKSDGDSTSLLSSATDEDCASVTLDPLEHEWMLCASDGLWESLQPLLSVEPCLVAKRDFVTGFTCLHWAAKQGKAELLSQLLVFAKENAIPVNVNVRSSAGYTPLHLAAMHGHTQVVRVLLSDWEADPEARDYSGRRAIQYLSPPLAADLQEEGVVLSPGAESDSENTNSSSGGGRGWRFPRVLTGNLNPLRLLNPPAEAAEEAFATGRTKGGIQRKSSLSRLNARLHRGRHRAQIIHSASFRDPGEVGRGEELPSSPLRTRPLSNLFG
uniref:Sosondowah ankyrin repeat domain family member C n=1 Tax=Dicentrarchus labrax TaxID=13489 RepID=A0A8C4DJG1_DICLA